jgi:hypothetical protein
MAMPDTPLRPDELETYKTDVQTEAESTDSDIPTPGTDSRPWVALGLVLFVVFIGALLIGAMLVIVR